MGIRGLTTFITKYSDIYLEDFELKDTYLVIDGCSLAAQLYRSYTKANDSFGGDYDKYRKVIIELFTNLQKSNVKTLVIIDGGFEYKKLTTLYTRMKNRVSTSRSINPSNQGYYQLSPLLQMEVFKEVLREMEIKIILCDFEADFQIAAVARYIKCPVLSLDSDYFIYDCLYIPINTFDMQLHTSKGSSYFKCKLYRVDTFLNRFGGLDKSLLPLVATLLGNDYVNKSTFEAFFSQLKLRHSRTKMNDQQRTIAALLDWLRPHTFESAKERVLGRVKMNLRSEISKIIDESVEGYNCSSAYILEHFGIVNDNPNKKINTDCYVLCDSSDYKKRKYKVPNWFIEKYRIGIYPSSFINLITKQTQLCTPQIEDVSLIHSHNICLDILKVIFGLLTAPKRYPLLAYITRSEHHSAKLYREETIHEIEGICNFPPLDEFHLLDIETKNKIFYYTCKFSDSDFEILNDFPDDWKFIVASIIYWIRTIDDLKVSKYHLLSLLLCIVYLKCVDPVGGFHRSQQVFLNKLKSQIALILEEKQQGQNEIEYNNDNLRNIIQNVTKNDAILAINLLISYFNMNEKLLTNPKNYSVRTVHYYAEFQAGYRQLSYLNCLLDNVFTPCSVATFYNGTFIYNLYSNIYRRNDPLLYLQNVLKPCGTVLNVYNKVVNMFNMLTPDVFNK